MAEKSISKRLIALVLGVCMVCTTCFQGLHVSANENEITNLTLSDIGITAGSYDSGATGTRAEGFANTNISFYATATGTYTPRIHFGTWGETDRSGINVLFYGEALVVGNDGFDSEADRKLDYTRTEIYANDFGLTSFLEAKILYQLKTEYLALDTDGEKNDIRFTLYINQTEAVKVDIKDQTDKLGNYIYFCDGVFGLEDYEVVETEFTDLTLSELGITGGSYDSGVTGTRAGGFANTNISFYATATGTYTPRIHFGTWGETDRSGINVLFYGEALVVGNDGFDSEADRKLEYTRTEIYASDFDLTSFLGEKILYQLQTEYLALDADGVVNDIRFTLYVNQTKAVKVNIKDQTDKLGNYIYFCDGVFVLEDYKEPVQEKPDEVEKQELTNLKLSDIGIADGSYDSGATGVREESYANTSIRFYATAKGTNTPRIHFGTWGEIDRSGINILLYGEALVVGNDGFDSEADRALDYTRVEILASDFELDSFLEEKILYQLDTEYLALDTDEVVNDIRFTLYVNEIEAVQINIKDQTDKLGNYIYFCDGVFELEDYKEPVQEKPDEVEKQELTNLKLSDIGIADGSYDSGATGVREESYANTSIRFYATAKGTNTPRIHFGTWGEIDRSGINILLFGETLVVGNDGFDSEADRKLDYTRTEIYASDFELDSFLEEKILYQLDTEYLALDTDEAVNDIRFTLYVNEVEAVKVNIKDQTDKLGNYIYFCDGVFLLEDEVEPEEEIPVELCTTYKKMTLRDYLLEEISVLSGSVNKVYDNQTLHGTSFGATFNFSEDNNGTTAFYLGGTEWCGIRIEALADGTLGVSHVGIDGKQTWLASVVPGEVGMKTFLGEAFELMMTFDIYGESEGRVNCKIGLYINGKLYNDNHLTLKNVEKDTLTRKLFIYGSGQGAVSINSIYKKVDFSIWGLTENWKQTLGIS